MLPGIIGTFQATEAIKLLTGIGEPMIGKLLHYDALSSRFKSFNITQDPKCRLCGENPSINEPMEIKGHCNNKDSLPEIEIKELEKIINASKNYNVRPTSAKVSKYVFVRLFKKNIFVPKLSAHASCEK